MKVSKGFHERMQTNEAEIAHWIATAKPAKPKPDPKSKKKAVKPTAKKTDS